jgi:hypothetical protein
LLSTLSAACKHQRAHSIYNRCGAYWRLMRDDALRIVMPIIILAALALSFAAFALFGLTAPPIWVVTPDVSAPRGP